MSRQGRRATVANIASLIVAGASVLPACDIEGVTPKCSDGGECLTPPGTSDPSTGGTGATGGGGGTTGGTGGVGGDGGASGGTGGTGGAGGTGTGATGGTAGSAGSGGRGGAGGSAGSAAGAAGSTGGTAGSGTADAAPIDAGSDSVADRRADTAADGLSLDTGVVLDVRTDATDANAGPD